MRFAVGFALVGIIATSGLAQRSITLTRADVEFAEPFSVIAGIKPLRDGRVIVSDTKEKTLQLITFGGNAKPIGRQGSGPREWLNPGALAALPGDSSAMWDYGNRRFLIITPDGAAARELQPATTNYGAFSAMVPRGVDARGNLYFQGSPFIHTSNGPAPADTIPVLRYDRARDVADTVAFIRPQAGNATVSAGPNGRGSSISNGRSNPLVPQDDWVVFPNGRVAVVRGADYHVDFYEQRQIKNSGAPATWDRRPVDASIREAVIEERRKQAASLAPRTGPTGQVSAMSSDAIAKFMNLEPWPQTTPPFMRSAAIVRTAGASPQIWVRLTNVKDDAPSQYDVFDEAGKVIARVQVPPRTQIVGFGPQVVYAIRTDDDDLQYLQRYKLIDF